MLYRPRLIKNMGLQNGIRDLFDPQSLLEFVPFLIWWLLLTWLAYSYAGEKMPWLSIHFVIPMGMLSGWYFNEKLVSIRAKDLFSKDALILMGLTILLVVTIVVAIGPLLLGRIQLGDQQLENLTNIGRFLGAVLLVGLVTMFWRRYYRKVPDSLHNPL